MTINNLIINISNALEVPSKIKYNNEIFEYNNDYQDYESVEAQDKFLFEYLFSNFCIRTFMYTTVEIIEEDEKMDFEEIEELKKQLEEKNILIKQCELSVSKVMDCYCERTDCSGRIKDSKQYDSLVQKVENQQEEFIKYLENEIKACKAVSDLLFNFNKEIKVYKEILQKYKEIVGVSNDY